MRQKKSNPERAQSRRLHSPALEEETIMDEQIVIAQLDGLVMDDVTPPHPATLNGKASDDSNAEVTAIKTQPSREANASGSKVAPEPGPQDELLQVVSTPDRGLAVFTTRKIKAGTLVLAETPLISLDKDEENDSTAIERDFSKLSRPDQKVYLRLFDAEKSRMSRVVSIYYSNCYNCDGFKANGQGGSAIGVLASRINHSCLPNAQFSYDEASNKMRFYTIRDIPRGKELSSNYDRTIFEVAAKRQRKQQIYYGFMCNCEACEPKNGFWGKSDERRKGMYDAYRVAQGCEKRFSESGQDTSPEDETKRKAESVDEALEALARLEGLLVKEGLVGVPLANTYRSLAKWTERKGDLNAAWKWKNRELGTCIVGFGKDARRTKEIEAKLGRLKQGIV